MRPWRGATLLVVMAAAATAVACNAILGISGDVVDPTVEAGAPRGGKDAAAESGPQPDGGLALDPLAALELVQGGTVKVPLHIARGAGTKQIVAVEIAGLPDTVTVNGGAPSGAAALLSADTGEIELVADTFAVRGDSSLVFKASDGVETSTQKVTLTVRGPIDTSFGDGGVLEVPFAQTIGSPNIVAQELGLAVADDRSIWVTFTTPAPKTNPALAMRRYDPDGKPIVAYGDAGSSVPMPDRSARARAAAALADGSAVVVGEMVRVPGVNASGFSYLVGFAEPDAGFTPYVPSPDLPDGSTGALHSVQAVGNVAYAAGASGNTGVVFRIVDGGTDPGFAPVLKSNGVRVLPYEVQVAETGELALFGEIGGPVALGSVARLDSDGGFELGFADAGVALFPVRCRSGAFAAGGAIVAACADFDASPGGPQARLTRLTATGARDPAFGDAGEVKPGELAAPSEFWAAHVLDAGSLVAAGYEGASATTGAGTFAPLIKLDANGKLDDSFGAHGIMLVPERDPANHGGIVFRRIAQQGDKLIVAGLFVRAGNVNAIVLRIEP